MDFKTKALFLFGILLFGIVLSYFLGGTFMEGFDTPTPTPTNPSITPAVTKSDDTSKKSYDNYNHYNDMTSTQYFGSTGTPINPIREDDKDISSTTPLANDSINNSTGQDYGTQYYSTLPPGIPASQIMPGDEHLYILKSEIVPPVCPVCPAFPCASVVNNNTPPPPCPPCGRCPEPSFECKKVPNYNAVNSDTMPIPVLNDFSSFGM